MKTLDKFFAPFQVMTLAVAEALTPNKPNQTLPGSILKSGNDHLNIISRLDAVFFSLQLRNQAETELRALRAELTQKKINISFNRSKQLNVGAVDLSPQTPIPTQR